MIHLISRNQKQALDLISVRENLALLFEDELICVDTETTGLDPLVDELTTIQIGTRTDQYIIDVKSFSKRELRAALKPMMESRKIRKILVNAKFDYKFLKVHLGIVLANAMDIFLVEKCIYNGLDIGFSLLAMTKRYANLKAEDELALFEEAKKDVRVSFRGGDLNQKQVTYAAQDVTIPFIIYDKQRLRIELEDKDFLVRLESEFALVLGDMEINGFYVNQRQWLSIHRKNSAYLDASIEQLHTVLMEDEVDERFHDINWDSPKQVVELFKLLGVDTLTLDKTKSTFDDKVYKDSVSKLALEKKKKQHRIVPLYLEYKEIKKAISSYGRKFLKKWVHKKTGRIHCEFLQIKNTGRTGTAKPNIQNIKRGDRYRSSFTIQNPDDILVVADWSQQELRYAAHVSQDKKMVAEYTKGDGDLHTRTAQLLFGKVKVTKQERHVGKTANFLTTYGGGPHKLADQFNFPFEKARGMIDKYYASYPKLKGYFKRVAMNSLRNGVIKIDPVTNRTYIIPNFAEYKHLRDTRQYYLDRGWQVPDEIKAQYGKLKSEITRKSQNYPIQGGCASIAKLACVLFRRYVEKNHAWNTIKMVNIIHDEIVVDTKRYLAQRVERVLLESMSKAGEYFSSVPMKVDLATSMFWEH